MSTLREELIEVKNKVEVYFSVGRYDAAEKLLLASIASYGHIANLENLLGLCYHKQNKFPDAITRFKNAIQKNPQFIESSLNLAAVLCDLSQYEEAKIIYERVSQFMDAKYKQPTMVMGRIANQHVNTADLYIQSGLFKEAIAQYKKALKIYPDMADVKLNLAKAYIEVKNLSDAQTELQDLLELRPNMQEATILLGQIHFQNGKTALAKELWKFANELQPLDITSKILSSL